MIGAGVGGLLIAGPIGAITGGIAGGTGMDALTTLIESKIHGEVVKKCYIIVFYLSISNQKKHSISCNSSF